MEPKPEEEIQPLQTQQTEGDKKKKKKPGKPHNNNMNSSQIPKKDTKKDKKKKEPITEENPPDSPLLFEVYEPKDWDPEQTLELEQIEGQEPQLNEK